VRDDEDASRKRRDAVLRNAVGAAAFLTLGGLAFGCGGAPPPVDVPSAAKAVSVSM
jgi:hypothetical protein